MNSTYKSTLEYSRSLQEKYEYYFIALTFTLLALSVQTTKFTDDKITTLFLLFGWALLLASGFIALIRLEKQPNAHKGYAVLDEKIEMLSALKEGRLVAESDTKKLIIDLEAWVKRNEPLLKSFESKIIFQYTIQKYLFFLGVLFVIFSRAYIPVIGLFSATCHLYT